MRSPGPSSTDQAPSGAAVCLTYLCVIHGLSYSSRECALTHLKFAHGLGSYDGNIMKEERF